MTTFFKFILIELVLLAFSIMGIFSLDPRPVSRKIRLSLKIFFSLLLIALWASLIWSDLFPNYEYYFWGMWMVHFLFLVLSVFAIISMTRKITIIWIRYLLRIMGIALIACLEYIMAVVVAVGIGY